MLNLIFHTPNGWRWNKFPEKPCECHPSCKHPFQEEGICRQRSGVSKEAYESQVAELMASALEVANPDIIDSFNLKGKLHIHSTDHYHPIVVKDNELYPWP